MLWGDLGPLKAGLGPCCLPKAAQGIEELEWVARQKLYPCVQAQVTGEPAGTTRLTPGLLFVAGRSAGTLFG